MKYKISEWPDVVSSLETDLEERQIKIEALNTFLYSSVLDIDGYIDLDIFKAGIKSAIDALKEVHLAKERLLILSREYEQLCARKERLDSIEGIANGLYDSFIEAVEDIAVYRESIEGKCFSGNGVNKTQKVEDKPQNLSDIESLLSDDAKGFLDSLLAEEESLSGYYSSEIKDIIKKYKLIKDSPLGFARFFSSSEVRRLLDGEMVIFIDEISEVDLSIEELNELILNAISLKISLSQEYDDLMDQV